MHIKDFSIEQFRNWFVDGVRTMSGEKGSDLTQAFEPAASNVAYSREYDWVNDVVQIIKAFPQDSKERADAGINQGIIILALGVNNENFASLNAAMSIASNLKSVNVSTLSSVLETLIPQNESLNPEISKQLFAQCALCVFETDIAERNLAKPLLVKAIRAAQVPMTEFLKERLLAFGVNPLEIAGTSSGTDFQPR